MPTYQSGDVLLLSFPFVDAENSKRRPALVLLDTGDNDVVVVRITGQIQATSFDIELLDWQQAGLRLPSFVRVHKIATLEKQLAERQLGTLSLRDWQQVQATLQQLIQEIQE
jgi:mRNA interferase MazF